MRRSDQSNGGQSNGSQGQRAEVQDVLESYVRGAQQMLAAVLEEEVNASLGRHRYQRGQTIRGYRNGYHPARELTVGLGPVAVRVPRVAQVPREVAPQGFHSQVVQRYQRASQTTQRLFARLYLEGLATGDFSPDASGELVGETTALSANPDRIGAADGALGPGIPGVAAAFSGNQSICLHLGRWGLPVGGDRAREDGALVCPWGPGRWGDAYVAGLRSEGQGAAAETVLRDWADFATF